jgi:hypothetical protein
MNTPLSKLNARRDALEMALSDRVANNPEPCDSWPACAGEADIIKDHAGIHPR